jgi:23S rRNA (adenine2030-N6)-methyltransferase
MLSYRHGFHAGGFADVHKHIALMLMLRSLLNKDTPFCCLDTHAGAGEYDLRGRFAQTGREYETGIGRLWGRPDPPEIVADYLAAVRLFNHSRSGSEEPLRYYPGSPRLIQSLLRPRDRMILVERHNTDAPLLRRAFARDARVAVHHRDGYEALPALVPPAERRGLVFIDPSFELKNEFHLAVDTLAQAWRKWPTPPYLLWYPVQALRPLPAFHRALKRSGITRILIAELMVAPDDTPNRLSGSGLVIVNPPWHFAGRLRQAQDWIGPLMDRGARAGSRVEWLVRE